MRDEGDRETERQVIRHHAKLSAYRAVDSFCGPGGMSLGLERAGFNVVAAFDLNELAVRTYKSNLKKDVVVADAHNFCLKIEPRSLALFAGGPPCQGFSKQKKNAHLGADTRNGLVSEYIKMVQGLKPRFFLFENVAIFGQKRGQEYLGKMKTMLRGYDLTPHFYNSADYGLAQTRERFIVVGRRKDQKTAFRIPQPLGSKWKTVGEELDGLPEPPEDYSDHSDFPNHQRARVTDINIKRFSFVPQGGGWQDIPDKYRLNCHKNVNVKSGGWPDVYGRLEWDGQCPTITGGFDSFTRGRYGHPLHDRPLTPREAARIQGFPDSFIFRGTRADIRSQIGNAVPPPLAEAIGLEILRSLLVADGKMEEDVNPELEQVGQRAASVR